MFTLKPQNVIVFENRLFAYINQFMMKTYWINVTLIQ